MQTKTRQMNWRYLRNKHQKHPQKNEAKQKPVRTVPVIPLVKNKGMQFALWIGLTD